MSPILLVSRIYFGLPYLSNSEFEKEEQVIKAPPEVKTFFKFMLFCIDVERVFDPIWLRRTRRNPRKSGFH